MAAEETPKVLEHANVEGRTSEVVELFTQCRNSLDLHVGAIPLILDYGDYGAIDAHSAFRHLLLLQVRPKGTHY